VVSKPFHKRAYNVNTLSRRSLLISFLLQSIVASQTSLLISERIVYVNEHFTRTLHHSICRALFNVDRQLFTVLLAFAALRSKVHLLIIFYKDVVDLSFIFQSNVQQETIDRLYAEKPLPPSHWIGPSWIANNTWQHIMDLSQTIEKYHCAIPS
jgi:dynein heavy chain